MVDRVADDALADLGVTGDLGSEGPAKPAKPKAEQPAAGPIRGDRVWQERLDAEAAGRRKAREAKAVQNLGSEAYIHKGMTHPRMYSDMSKRDVASDRLFELARGVMARAGEADAYYPEEVLEEMVDVIVSDFGNLIEAGLFIWPLEVRDRFAGKVRETLLECRCATGRMNRFVKVGDLRSEGAGVSPVLDADATRPGKAVESDGKASG